MERQTTRGRPTIAATTSPKFLTAAPVWSTEYGPMPSNVLSNNPKLTANVVTNPIVTRANKKTDQ